MFLVIMSTAYVESGEQVRRGPTWKDELSISSRSFTLNVNSTATSTSTDAIIVYMGLNSESTSM